MWKSLLSWRMIVVFFLGISSGIPLLAIGSTLQAWMTEAKVDLKLIGLFAFVGLPYTLKFLWSPLMDRFVPPFLGRRRGWILLTQVALALSMACLGMIQPGESPFLVALVAFVLAFFSASQDIVIDAYRREILPPQEMGLGSSMGVNGYRVGMLISGAFALFLSTILPWNQVYLVIGASFGLVMLITIFAPEPEAQAIPPRTLKEAVIEPLRDFFSRSDALSVLLFILLFKVGDAMASHLTTPYILATGFTKLDIAAIAKTLGLFATLLGGFLGGMLLLRMPLKSALVYFGILQAGSTLAFVLLGWFPGDTTWLASVMVFENISSGMGTSAFTAFLSLLTNRRFTATQFALLSSLIGVPRTLLAMPTGWLAEVLGWSGFFVFCTLAAVPGLIMLIRGRIRSALNTVNS